MASANGTRVRRQNAYRTKRFLLRHLQRTLPFAANPVTSVDEVHLYPERLKRSLGYRWQFTHGYGLPQYRNGRRKDFYSFSQKDRNELKRAIEKGWMRAVFHSEEEDIDGNARRCE